MLRISGAERALDLTRLAPSGLWLGGAVLGASRSTIMKRYLLAALVSVMLVGFALAEEFTLQITSIGDDGAVTGKKIAIGKKGGGGKGQFGKAEEVTVKLAKDVKVQKGKFDAEAKAFAGDGDDLKLAGLKAAIVQAQNGSVLVSGKGLTSSDALELTVRDGKPVAKLNGKDIPFSDVTVRAKGSLNTRVTTNDDGVVTSVLITGGGFGGGFRGKSKTTE
jgi:hypothetical protein